MKTNFKGHEYSLIIHDVMLRLDKYINYLTQIMVLHNTFISDTQNLPNHPWRDD